MLNKSYMNNLMIIEKSEEEQKIITNHIEIKNEKHRCVDYKNQICIKPWGHEFLVYQSDKIGIWFLKINNGHKTSLHCHFNKDTIIFCLKGCAVVELFNKKTVSLSGINPMFLPHYSFHSLGSYSQESYILEIEVYNKSLHFSDKNDLLRIDDVYKRRDNVYENSINTIKENLKDYGHFYIDSLFKNNICGVDISVSEINSNNLTDFAKISSDCNLLLDGEIFQNFKYLREGSIIDSFEKIQFLNDRSLILSLKKITAIEDSKIIYNNEQLNNLVSNLKFNNKKIILTSGCFDIIHIGHINTLIESKKLGDVLIVCLSSDEQIKKLKGQERPINNYEDRINLFKSISYVDYIVLYNEENIEAEETLGTIMKVVDPFYWVKGSDYSLETIHKKHPYLKNVFIINNIPEKSTTNLIKQLKK